MKEVRINRIFAGLLLLALLVGAFPGRANTESRNPLLSPASVARVQTEDEFLNVALFGLDLGFEGYQASGLKTEITEAHTDVVMVVAVNKTKNVISLISIPRDTVVYVPGVYGIYKLNAAYNCSSGVRSGLRRACDTVSWLLGGVRIDAYCALDMEALVLLGDALGGVDFDLDMAYVGSSGRIYEKGSQHLDGLGIMDYVRARHNAEDDDTDLGRTNRARQMVTAILQKLMGDWELVDELWSLSNKSSVHFYTNLNDQETLLSLWDMAEKLDGVRIGSYVLDGEYRLALSQWNFTFTDQQNRRDVIRAVYGVEADEIPYVSKEYLDWLMDQGGLSMARAIRLAGEILEFARWVDRPTAAMKNALAACETAYAAAVSAFDAAADSLSAGDTARMAAIRRELTDSADQVAQLFRYTRRYDWNLDASAWFEDPMINEYSEINWQ